MATWTAGERIVADKLSTYAGEPEIRESNVGTFTTTETVVDTITVPLVEGRRYKVVWKGGFQSSVADGYVRAAIREDNVSGALMQIEQTGFPAASQRFGTPMEAFYTAVSTGDKTFVATGDRQTGTGNITAVAGAGFPAHFYVENA